MTVCTTKRLTLHYEGDLLGDGGDREPVVCLAGVAASLVPPHLLGGVSANVNFTLLVVYYHLH